MRRQRGEYRIEHSHRLAIGLQRAERPAELRLDAEIAAGRDLAYGVADAAGDREQRQFAFAGDRGQERLDDRTVERGHAIAACEPHGRVAPKAAPWRATRPAATASYMLPAFGISMSTRRMLDQAGAPTTVFTSMKSVSPNLPFSRPLPDCL